jgi:YfiH family protein
MEWHEENGVRWLEASLPGATAAFSTRVGGISEPPFEGLNLGLLTDDEPDAVTENHRRLAAAVGFPLDRIAIGLQVHGAELIANQPPLRCSLASYDAVKEQADGQPLVSCSFPLHAGEKEQRSGVVEADGQVVVESGFAALVFVADCVPVALSGLGGVAMLHCGWRGLAAGIVARGVEAVGAVDAAIGPSIGPCCYEVGTDVLSALPTGRRPGSDSEGSDSENGPVDRVDLAAIAAGMLHEAGVERVETSGLCTSCETDLFFSHRRDSGRTGRQAGVVWRHREGG